MWRHLSCVIVWLDSYKNNFSTEPTKISTVVAVTWYKTKINSEISIYTKISKKIDFHITELPYGQHNERYVTPMVGRCIYEIALHMVGRYKKRQNQRYVIIKWPLILFLEFMSVNQNKICRRFHLHIILTSVF